MTQYINKDALVAEIERLRKEDGNPYFPSETADMYYARGVHFTCDGLINFLNSIEVEEADIEKELVYYHNENFSPCNDGTLLSCETGSELTWYDYERIAKHFFELGMAVRNKSQKGK